MDDGLARVLIGVLHAKDGITQLRDEYLNSIAAELAQTVRDYLGAKGELEPDAVATMVAALRAWAAYEELRCQMSCPHRYPDCEDVGVCPARQRRRLTKDALRAAGEEVS